MPIYTNREKNVVCISVSFFQALLKMDCQGLVARLVMDFVLLTTAVEVAGRWRELAERLAKVSRQQMEAYEAPHRDIRGQLDSEVKQTHNTPKPEHSVIIYSPSCYPKPV